MCNETKSMKNKNIKRNIKICMCIDRNPKELVKKEKSKTKKQHKIKINKNKLKINYKI